MVLVLGDWVTRVSLQNLFPIRFRRYNKSTHGKCGLMVNLNKAAEQELATCRAPLPVIVTRADLLIVVCFIIYPNEANMTATAESSRSRIVGNLSVTFSIGLDVPKRAAK